MMKTQTGLGEKQKKEPVLCCQEEGRGGNLVDLEDGKRDFNLWGREPELTKVEKWCKEMKNEEDEVGGQMCSN